MAKEIERKFLYPVFGGRLFIDCSLQVQTRARNQQCI